MIYLLTARTYLSNLYRSTLISIFMALNLVFIHRSSDLSLIYLSINFIQHFLAIFLLFIHNTGDLSILNLSINFIQHFLAIIFLIIHNAGDLSVIYLLLTFSVSLFQQHKTGNSTSI